MADTLLLNARIATLDRRWPHATAAAIEDGRFLAVGSDREVMAHRGPHTRVIDVQGRRVIPGLVDSHTHAIRGGRSYHLELGWAGVTSLADALDMLRDQGERTPPPHWVRVAGGWSPYQFAERRMPTLAEINAAAPETPVFVQHLSDRAWLNAAALRAVGYTRDTPDPPGGEIQRNAAGTPTGLLIARPGAQILLATLAKGPTLSPEEQRSSMRGFMRELNRFGLTSALDAGACYQSYPDDYALMDDLHQRDELTVRIAYNLSAQRPKHEYEDFVDWIGMVSPGDGDDWYRCNGAGETLVFSAADFENFLEPRPALPPSFEPDLSAVVRLLAEHRWPFRLHATYDETIARALDVFEAVNREVPFGDLRWWLDHAETISPRSLDRVAALGGGVAIQNRLAFQGEYFLRQFGPEIARETPPLHRMLEAGLPVGAGTDATQVSSYNPWLSLAWLVTGRTVGGAIPTQGMQEIDRESALRLWTVGSAWFSGDEGRKGTIAPGQLADLAVLSADYFVVPDDQIGRIESVLTMVGGRVVYAADVLRPYGPPPLEVKPAWSPVVASGGYAVPSGRTASGAARSA